MGFRGSIVGRCIKWMGVVEEFFAVHHGIGKGVMPK